MGGARIGLAAALVALSVAGAAWAQPPTPPPRPQGLAPEAPPRDAPALRDPLAPGGAAKAQEIKPQSGAAQPATAPDAAPTPPERPDELRKAGSQVAPSPGDACMVELAALGADAPRAEAPPAGDMGCAVDAPVRLRSVQTKEGRIAIHGEPLIACAAARAAALFLAQTVSPLARGATGQTLSGVTAAGFQCRPRNRVEGGKLSAHGKGLALDVTSFQFSDASTMTVAAPSPERAAMFAGIRKAACGYFTTVLGPGADESHRDHLHLDIEAHGSSGYGRICQ